MRTFLIGKSKGLSFEVLSYDPVAHVAVLRGVDGIVTDNNFHIYMVKRVYTMTHDEPECLRG